MKPDRVLDIRGEVCPYTYVKARLTLEEMKTGQVLSVQVARLALEEMKTGQVLSVQVDYEPAIRSVPRSVTIQGDEILSVMLTQPGEWEILIRKQGA